MTKLRFFAFCTFSGDLLSKYEVSYSSPVNFQRYAPNIFFIAKLKKGSNSENTGDGVIVLAFCTSTFSSLSVYQVSFIYL